MLKHITYCKQNMRLTFIWHSWDRAPWYISIVKATSCTIFEFIKYHSTCFGRSFRPSSGVQDCTHSIMYVIQVSWLLASGHEVPASKQSTNLYDIPDAVCTVLNCRWWTERPSGTCRVVINKLENCAASCFYYRNTAKYRCQSYNWRM
jgi:hypothetical protein